MDDSNTTELHVKYINDMTDDLLEIADVLEANQVNVKLDNGRYLNPVSAIRNKVDVIWEDTLAIQAETRRADESEREKVYNAGFDNGIKATLQQLDGLLIKTDSAVEIQAWVDEQWKEFES